MAVSPKILRRRIKSIANTKKITKAMELVAAAKMRKAVQTTTASRPYARSASRMLAYLAEGAEPTHALTEIRPPSKILLILIASNRGLCGGYNANVLKKLASEMKDQENLFAIRVRGKKINVARSFSSKQKDTTPIEAITVGRKGERMMARLTIPIVASFTRLSDIPTFAEVRPIARIAIQGFIEKKYDKVVIAYTDFVSAMRQETKLRQLLPITSHELEKMIKQAHNESAALEEISAPAVSEFIFEPNVDVILDAMLPQMVEVQVFQSILEASASEHSSRMIAMRGANDAAEEMLDDLVFTFNQARQAGITREIAEISGGAAALE